MRVGPVGHTCYRVIFQHAQLATATRGMIMKPDDSSRIFENIREFQQFVATAAECIRLHYNALGQQK